MYMSGDYSGYEDVDMRFLISLYQGWPWMYDRDSVIEMQSELIRRLDGRLRLRRPRAMSCPFPEMKPRVKVRRVEFAQCEDDVGVESRRNSL